jgi:hypothetical protein
MGITEQGLARKQADLLARQLNLQRAQMGLPPRATDLPKFTQRRLAQAELIAHQNLPHAAIAARLELRGRRARIVDQECAKICAANRAACPHPPA